NRAVVCRHSLSRQRVFGSHMPLPTRIKLLLQIPRDLAKFTWCYWRFGRTGSNPDTTIHQWLHCRTDGVFNNAFTRLNALFHPPLTLGRVDGVLGPMGSSELARVKRDLDARGLHIFEKRLAPELCDALVDL